MTPTVMQISDAIRVEMEKIGATGEIDVQTETEAGNARYASWVGKPDVKDIQVSVVIRPLPRNHPRRIESGPA